MTDQLPTGTVTFLFTDVEGSTRLWEEAPDSMMEAIRQHDEAIEGAALAHRGVLFLDELPEFGERLLEVLRQPLEGFPREVSISRASGTITFPANFMLIAALNPCPCGYQTDPKRECRCSPTQIARYRSKISGPLLDRIDIHIEVPAVPHKELTSETPGTSSRLLDGLAESRDESGAPALNVWMSHGDAVEEAPAGFKVMASTAGLPVALPTRARLDPAVAR